MNLIVVGEPAGKLAHDGQGVRSGRDPDVIAFHGTHERLSHAVALRALDRRCPGLQTQITREAARLVLGGAIYDAVCRRTKIAFGPSVNLHLISGTRPRLFGASRIPKAVLGMRDLLGHRS